MVIVDRDFPEVYVFATTGAKARWRAVYGFKDAGYKVKWSEVYSKRRRDLDHQFIPGLHEKRCLSMEQLLG